MSPRGGETCNSAGLKDLGPGNVGRKGESAALELAVSFLEHLLHFVIYVCYLLFAFAHCTEFQHWTYTLTTQRALKNRFLGPNKDQLNQDLWDWTWELAPLQCAQVILMYLQS